MPNKLEENIRFRTTNRGHCEPPKMGTGNVTHVLFVRAAHVFNDWATFPAPIVNSLKIVTIELACGRSFNQVLEYDRLVCTNNISNVLTVHQNSNFQKVPTRQNMGSYSKQTPEAQTQTVFWNPDRLSRLCLPNNQPWRMRRQRWMTDSMPTLSQATGLCTQPVTNHTKSCSPSHVLWSQNENLECCSG